MTSPTIISLGGSLVVPDAIDTAFVRNFQTLIESRVAEGNSFIIIIGGGKVARRYQDGARELGVTGQNELDWVGIYATRLNAELLRIVFGEKAHSEIITDPSVLPNVSTPIAIGAGWKPGWSTDFDSVEMASTVGAKRVVNLSNIDYAYDKDPKQFTDAKKIERASWKEFRAILPIKWTPGINAPFDPVAARRADELHLEIAIMNGNNLLNFKNYLEGKPFAGTVISG